MPHLVVTSISAPNPVLSALAEGSKKHGWRFLVLGDAKSPPNFSLDGCRYYSLEEQRKLHFAYGRLCPENSYCRKNLGYLIAMHESADSIVETDDDNFPLEKFWNPRLREVSVHQPSIQGWINPHGWFSDQFCYPRGIPLSLARESWEAIRSSGESSAITVDCPLQQGLADQSPDVDAVYRMLYPDPVSFYEADPLALGRGQWSPVNSQNTTWFPCLYPLLYLPSTCSFRMTDIWRGLIAQRILWECGWKVLHHSATVRQERNPHDPSADFAMEVPGYLHNAKLADVLLGLELEDGVSAIPQNLRTCYRKLVESQLLDPLELKQLDSWLDSMPRIPQPVALDR